MPKPASPKGKAGKLPTWAYIVAAGVGLLIVFFLFRKPSNEAPAQPVDQAPRDDQLGTLTDLLAQLLNGAHGSGEDTGDGTGGGDTGGGNCIGFKKPCTGGGPNGENQCCTGNCSNNTHLCNCHTADLACKALHPEHYAEHPGKTHHMTSENDVPAAHPSAVPA